MHATGTGLVYSNAEMYNGSDADLGPSNEYNIDLAPKVSHAPEENSIVLVCMSAVIIVTIWACQWKLILIINVPQNQ